MDVSKCCFSKENRKSSKRRSEIFIQKLQNFIWRFAIELWSSMNVKRLRTLCVEISKTLNNLNSSFMKEIVSLRQTDRPAWEKYKLNLDIPSYNQVNFDCKALTFSGPKTWNSLSYQRKSAKHVASFKTMIKFWNEEPVAVKFVVKTNFFSWSG